VQSLPGGFDPGLKPVAFLPAFRFDEHDPGCLHEQDAQVAIAAPGYLAEDRLTDEQLTAILHAATPLHVADRDAFLQDVATASSAHPMVGDGLVARTCAEAQRR
jgi:hypothetical protein